MIGAVKLLPPDDCDLLFVLWLRSTALLFVLIVLDVADAATVAEARVAMLDEGLATGGLLNDAAKRGVDDNEIVVDVEGMDVEGMDVEEQIRGISF